MGEAGCSCTQAGDCNNNELLCNFDEICQSKSADDCLGGIGCKCLRLPTPDDVSGGCESPATCVNNLCVLQSNKDSIHGM